MTTFLIIVSAYYLLTTRKNLFTRRVKAVIGILLAVILLGCYYLIDHFHLLG